MVFLFRTGCAWGHWLACVAGGGITLESFVMNATPIFREPPSDNYAPTGGVAWFVGKYETDRVLAMLYESPLAHEPDAWVIVPEFRNPNVEAR